MATAKEEEQKKRFREISEAAALPENMAEGVLRLTIGVLKAANALPVNAKKGIPRLSKMELSASKSLLSSAFGLLKPSKLKARSPYNRQGFKIGLFVEGYVSLQRREMLPEEEDMLYTMLIVGLRLGTEVNAESKIELAEFIEKLKAFYTTRIELPDNDYMEFMKGYMDAKTFYSIGDISFTEMNDRQQAYFLVFGLNKQGANIRSVEEFEKFAKTETGLKLQNTSEALKKSLNLIHFEGAKRLKSKRNRKKLDSKIKRSPVK